MFTIGNTALIQECARLRPNKINAWLYQWIAAVQRFKPGMSLREASALYEQRYQQKLVADEQRDDTTQQGFYIQTSSLRPVTELALSLHTPPHAACLGFFN